MLSIAVNLDFFLGFCFIDCFVCSWSREMALTKLKPHSNLHTHTLSTCWLLNKYIEMNFIRPKIMDYATTCVWHILSSRSPQLVNISSQKNLLPSCRNIGTQSDARNMHYIGWNASVVNIYKQCFFFFLILNLHL